MFFRTLGAFPRTTIILITPPNKGERNAPWSMASPTVEKLQYYRGKTPVLPWWYWEHGVAPFAARHEKPPAEDRGGLGLSDAMATLQDAIATDAIVTA